MLFMFILLLLYLSFSFSLILFYFGTRSKLLFFLRTTLVKDLHSSVKRDWEDHGLRF